MKKMDPNLNIIRDVVIRGKPYPVISTGDSKDKQDCLCIGTGTLTSRTLPQVMTEYFNLHSCDLYWLKKNALNDEALKKIDMDVIAEDINEVAKQLSLSGHLLLAQSCFGITALEAMKRDDNHANGAILIAAGQLWTEESLVKRKRYFRENAEPERVTQYDTQQAAYKTIKKEGESEVSVNAYIADTALYWGDRNISPDFIKELWSGIEFDDGAANRFFGEILPLEYQDKLSEGIKKITEPVILFGGNKDYDSLPLLLWEEKFRTPNFTVVDCGNVGHWPCLEAADIYTEKLKAWLKKYFSK